MFINSCLTNTCWNNYLLSYHRTSSMGTVEHRLSSDLATKIARPNPLPHHDLWKPTTSFTSHAHPNGGFVCEGSIPCLALFQ
jgi:hypothetical protein